MRPAGVCSAPQHVQRPAAGAAGFGRKQRTLRSGLMEPSGVSSVTAEGLKSLILIV